MKSPLLAAGDPSLSMQAPYIQQAGWPKLPDGFAFRMVSNIAEDSTGRLYFVHRGARPLVRFDRDGNFIDALGEADLPQSVNYDLGKNPPQPIGREYWLHGLHVDPWDNIWVTDLGRHLVLKFDARGRRLLTLGQPGQPGEALDRFNQPTAVVVGRSGHIYVADGYGNSRIVKYSADGRPLLTWGRRGSAPGEFQTPHGLSVDADENIYVSERMNHRVQVFSPDGRALALWPDLCRADAIEVKGDHVYVGTGYGDNAIYRFTRDGRNRETVGGGRDAFGYPHGIHVDAAGSIHVADPVAENAAARPAKYLAA